MKSPSATTDDCDDIFGPPRTYPTGYNPPKSRLSMISPKYRQKEEQRKAWKMSYIKLSKIDDKDECLFKWVMINNIKKRLEKETMDETIHKHLNYPRYDNDNYLSLKNDFMFKNTTNYNESNFYSNSEDSFDVETDFDTKLAEEINEVKAKTMEALGNFVENNLNSSNLSVEETSLDNERFSSTKRSFDDLEDCDVQDVLSQLYMPPTPRMLTTIDDDEGEHTSKRTKFDALPTEDTSGFKVDKPSCDKSEFSVNNYLNSNVTLPETRLRYTQSESDSNSYSCGHASMFSDLQSNVYHNLIASLET